MKYLEKCEDFEAFRAIGCGFIHGALLIQMCIVFSFLYAFFSYCFLSL